MAAREEGRELLGRLFRAAESCNPKERLSLELARSLYGDTVTASVTRLELFASCSFRHFLSYGLRLGERDIYEFTPADFGTICHKALELFARQLKKQHLEWAALDDGTRDTLAEGALLDAVYSSRSDALLSSERTRHM
ncbi:PD-(D/E)XK nuclease family protein, partial [Vibrio sp. FNV 38]|nr:PD-(D/E)XK nuclease family protein [Vibrio sp. FNV 38]